MQPVQPPAPSSNEDAASTALALAEAKINSLANPGEAISLISDALNYISVEGNDPAAMDAVQGGVQQLIETVATLDQAFKSAMVAAKAIQEQRKEALSSLETLRDAVRGLDTDHPDVADLYEGLQDDLYDSLWFDDTINNEAIDRIEGGSALDYDEALLMWDLLTDGQIHGGSILWDDLRDWLKRAERDSRLKTAGRRLVYEPLDPDDEEDDEAEE